MPVTMENLEELDKKIEDLRKNYEAYFQGMNRIPPERDFQQIQGIIRKYKEEYIVNTAVKFRLSTLISKFQAYSRYWARVIREIEEGRYVRDRFKAELHLREREKIVATSTQQSPGTLGRKPADDLLDPEKLTSLHKEYMIARLECNQKIEGLTKEHLRQSIEKSLPELKKRYPGKKIEFKVVIENGKAKLKAIPR
mgnify:CR=1 FL=1